MISKRESGDVPRNRLLTYLNTDIRVAQLHDSGSLVVCGTIIYRHLRINGEKVSYNVSV